MVLDRGRLVLDDREGEAVTDCGGPTTPCIEVDRVGKALGEDEVVTRPVTDGTTAAVLVAVEASGDEEGKRDVEAGAVLPELDALDEVVTTGSTAGTIDNQHPSRGLSISQCFGTYGRCRFARRSCQRTTKRDTLLGHRSRSKAHSKEYCRHRSVALHP